jgi:protein-disulfide isomerase
MAKAKEVAEIIPPKDIFVGDRHAPVTLMEFGEYENEDCAKANDIVKKLLEEFGSSLKFNFRHFPLTNIHQRSLKASEAAVAAAQDGKFWEMHNLLFAHRKQLGTISLKLYSKEAGVNNKSFLNQMVDGTFGWQVRGDMMEGLKKGIKKIPAFFINGEQYTGKISFEELKKAIAAAVKKSKRKVQVKQRA